MKTPKTILLLSVTSDIGKELAKNYFRDGYQIIGTYRKAKDLQTIKYFQNYHLFQCDINDDKSVVDFIKNFQKLHLKWDIFISCIGDPRPIQSFFNCSFIDWTHSIKTNSINQLRLLHLLYPYHNRKPSAVFFSGGGVNNAVINFSAYTISKIILIKMCEFLQAEEPDLNIFTVGPGWTKTKIHRLIINSTDMKTNKHQQTLQFLQQNKGTDINYIYDCINWLIDEGKQVAGGRNFSIVYDPLQQNVRQGLSTALKKDPDMYKLRRNKNNFLHYRI